MPCRVRLSREPISGAATPESCWPWGYIDHESSLARISEADSDCGIVARRCVVDPPNFAGKGSAHSN
jgi:hypothetical protein